MELTRTINSDKHYYLDETNIVNAASFLKTMRVFNDAKIQLYNALYDQRYLNRGPLLEVAYPAFLKKKFNDFFEQESPDFSQGKNATVLQRLLSGQCIPFVYWSLMYLLISRNYWIT